MGDDDVCYNLNRPAKPSSLLYHIRVYSKIRYWAPCLARALRNAFPKASWWGPPHGLGSGPCPVASLPHFRNACLSCTNRLPGRSVR